jgi:hypothetical protein
MEHPEHTSKDILDSLIAHGFAVYDQEMSDWWTRSSGKSYTMYMWTEAGRDACFRYRHTTPISWAIAAAGNMRHCYGCGRDLYRKPVGEQMERGRFKHIAVCMDCHRKGVNLPGWV